MCCLTVTNKTMSAISAIGSNGGLDETKWVPMMVLSVLFHLAVVVLFLFVPDSLPGRRMNGIVYEVNLVEMPSIVSRGKGAAAAANNSIESKAKAVIQKKSTTKRITVEKGEKKPLVIAKRTIRKKRSLIKKTDLSSSRLIDNAISKIEEKVQSEDTGHLDNALSKIEKSAWAILPVPLPSGGGGGAAGGITIRIYQMEIENRIKSNWSYPVAIRKSGQDLEALVIIKVKE